MAAPFGIASLQTSVLVIDMSRGGQRPAALEVPAVSMGSLPGGEKRSKQGGIGSNDVGDQSLLAIIFILPFAASVPIAARISLVGAANRWDSIRIIVRLEDERRT